MDDWVILDKQMGKDKSTLPQHTECFNSYMAASQILSGNLTQLGQCFALFPQHLPLTASSSVAPVVVLQGETACSHRLPGCPAWEAAQPGRLPKRHSWRRPTRSQATAQPISSWGTQASQSCSQNVAKTQKSLLYCEQANILIVSYPGILWIFHLFDYIN